MGLKAALVIKVLKEIRAILDHRDLPDNKDIRALLDHKDLLDIKDLLV
jgi:hypothetical protein